MRTSERGRFLVNGPGGGGEVERVAAGTDGIVMGIVLVVAPDLPVELVTLSVALWLAGVENAC